LLKVVDQFELKSFVFSSSCTVYGNPDTIPVVESTPTKPAFSPYGETKQMGEKILLDYFKNKTNCNLSLLRYFNPIGAHSSGKIGELPLGVPNNLVPFIMQTAVGKREALTVFGNDYDTPDGYCIRDYIHVVDLAEAHVLTLKYGMKKDHNPLILNVGTGKGHSVLEVIETFKREVGVKLNFKIGNRRAGDVPSIYADNKKIVALLGWKPRYSLADALVHAWKWEQEMKKHIG
ncbi:MAG: UDP-glucose 4-epimerase GalE, partial [Bacteroidota bacterium]|nr:UDP-glucose 4-epimerase GalE [Bacteroidota bacterium]